MRVTDLGHAAVHIETSGGDVLIDPFLSGNPRAGARPEEVTADLVVLTHAHGDHWGDTEAIAKRTGATVVGSAELATYARKRGLKAHGMNVGGKHAFPQGTVRYTPALHSNSLPDGTYAGMPMGVVIEADGVKVYHAGDTAYFSDMTRIGALGIDLALLPIGDNFTMGPEDAIDAVKAIAPKVVVPIHYKTFPVLLQDASSFAEAVRTGTSATCLVLEPGESTEVVP